MKCPICTTVELIMSERQGIEIDYCPQCRGVWLDRGELDKIIERSTVPQVAAAPAQPTYTRNTNENKYREESHHNSHDDHDNHNSSYNNNGYNKKKKSFLGEMFDF